MADSGPKVRESHRDMQAADSPPWTFTISGYVLPASKSLGNINQPSSFVVPLVQWKLRISPHAGFTSALTVVNCFHLPMGPTQISGGLLADWRMTALTDPSLDREALREGAVPATSSPAQRDCAAPPDAWTTENPDLPSTFSAKVI